MMRIGLRHKLCRSRALRRMGFLATTTFLVSLVWAPPGYAETASELDKYGGYRDIPVPGGATGVFRLAKLGSRWVFVTPEGHAFWLRAVYGVDPTNDGGPAYVEAIKRKYNSPGWIPWWRFVQQAARRLKMWGFNAIGEHSSPYTFPIPSYGRREVNPEPLPFIDLIQPAYWGKRWGGIKNIQAGVDPAVTPGLWRVEGFPDVFDPAFAALIPDYVRRKQMFDPVVIATSPWVIGRTMDDRDYLFGFGPRWSHNHLGWISATTAPSQRPNDKAREEGKPGPAYKDPKVYTKYAVRDFLRAKYSTIEALNAAWGSGYTTWDSDGGWPAGRGVLDESGRNPWIGKDFYYLKDSAPQVRADLDDFVGVLADKYFSAVSSGMRSVAPRHLVFGPAAIDANAHPKILEAAARYCDVLQIGGSYDVGAYRRVFALTKKPFFIWTTFMAQKDSALARHKGWGGVDFATQGERGQAYADFVRKILTFRADDGTYPIVGLDWWAWTDKVTGGENTNFGLVSNLDNAYDGREATVAPGKDPWDFPTGGEKASYGDFLGHVIRANESVAATFRAEVMPGQKQSQSRLP
jgi:agarase